MTETGTENKYPLFIPTISNSTIGFHSYPAKYMRASGERGLFKNSHCQHKRMDSYSKAFETKQSTLYPEYFVFQKTRNSV